MAIALLCVASENMEGITMSPIAKAAAKFETANAAAYVLPAVLGVNTLVLFALDAQGALPKWIKVAVTLFLSF